MVLVEVSRKPYLASLVPVIVNAILNDHQIVVDIVAFVNQGDFPRSRLGEKQRGKILAGWVTRKMRTVAQFNIRDDHDGDGDPVSAVAANAAVLEQHRQSISSMRSFGGGPGGNGSGGNGSGGAYGGASSLRNMEHAPQILEQEEIGHQMDRMATLPENYATNHHHQRQQHPYPHQQHQRQASGSGGPGYYPSGDMPPPQQQQSTPQIRLPVPPGGGQNPGDPIMYDDAGWRPSASPTSPNAPHQGYDHQGYGQAPYLGGVGVGGQDDFGADEEQWTRDAIAQMNLASGGGQGGGLGLAPGQQRAN